MAFYSNPESICSDEQREIHAGQLCDFDDCKETRVPAFGFCKDCADYLCEVCFRGHRNTKFTKHHGLLEKQFMPGKPIAKDLRNAKCDTCNDLNADVFCEEHKCLLCIECLKKIHGKCKTPDLDKSSAKIKVLGELDSHVTDLEVLKEQYSKQISLAQENEEQTKISEDNAVKTLNEIITLLKEKIHQLELRKSEVENAAVKDITNLQRIKALNNKAYIKVSDDLTALKSTCGRSLFVCLYRSKLSADRTKDEMKKVNRDNIAASYVFSPNVLLQNMLGNSASVGSLTISSSQSQIASKPGPLDGSYVEFEYQRSIAVANDCFILIDKLQNMVQKVDDTGVVYLKLSTFPWDLAAMENNLVALTQPTERKVTILKIQEPEIYIQREIEVNCQCEGIAYAKEKIFLASTDPPAVVVHDIKKAKNTTIKQNNFRQPAYIDASENPDMICLSDRETKMVFIMDWNGEQLKIISNTDMQLPLCVAFKGNTVIVLCFQSKTIHIIPLGNGNRERRYLEYLNLETLIKNKSFKSNALRQRIGTMLFLLVNKHQ